MIPTNNAYIISKYGKYPVLLYIFMFLIAFIYNSYCHRFKINDMVTDDCLEMLTMSIDLRKNL